MDPVVHFEIPAENMERAKKFYKTLFGWEMKTWPDEAIEYEMVYTTPSDEKGMPKNPGAINGGIRKKMGNGDAPVVVMNVSNVDTYIKKATQMGSKLIMPKTEMGGMGFYAMITDSEGNGIGLWQVLKQ